MTDVVTCPACSSHSIKDHCESPKCKWWRCRACFSYGNEQRHHDPRPKDARS